MASSQSQMDTISYGVLDLVCRLCELHKFKFVVLLQNSANFNQTFWTSSKEMRHLFSDLISEFATFVDVLNDRNAPANDARDKTGAAADDLKMEVEDGECLAATVAEVAAKEATAAAVGATASVTPHPVSSEHPIDRLRQHRGSGDFGNDDSNHPITDDDCVLLPEEELVDDKSEEEEEEEEGEEEEEQRDDMEGYDDDDRNTHVEHHDDDDDEPMMNAKKGETLDAENEEGDGRSFLQESCSLEGPNMDGNIKVRQPSGAMKLRYIQNS